MISGYGDETTTQKTELPEMTAEERALQQMSIALLPEYMKSAGYEMTPIETPKNPQRITELESRRAELQAQLDSARSAEAGGGITVGGPQSAGIEQQIKDIDKQITEAKNDTEITYDVNLTEYGQKQQAMREQALDYQQEATALFMENARKFLNGDFSITDAQKKEIQDSLSAIREPVNAMLNEVEKAYQTTGKSMTEALNEYIGEINKTGLSVGAALNAVGERIEDTQAGILGGIGAEEKQLGETGQAVKAALAGVRQEIDNTGGAAREALEQHFAIRRTLAKREMEDMYNTRRREIATKAAQLGRSPMDPSFEKELRDDMMRQFTTMELQMSEQEALQKVGLIESTGIRREQATAEAAGYEERLGGQQLTEAQRRTAAAESGGLRQEALAAERAGLAESTGIRREGAVSQGVNIAERTGAGMEQTAQQRAALEESLGQYGEGLRWQMGMGIPAQQIGIGMNVAEYQNAVQQQNLSNAAAAMQAPTQQQSMMQAERMAQPTVTTTTEGDPFGTFLGVLGAGAGAAGSIMGGYGAMQMPSVLNNIYGKTKTT